MYTCKFSKPINASGVEVSLNTLDPNGNYIHIGTALSDTSGKFGFQWTPEVPGKYTVYATFEGTNSFYSSKAETFVAVDPATVTPTTESLKTNSIADTYFIPAIAGLFVFIAIVGVAIILLQRNDHKVKTNENYFPPFFSLKLSVQMGLSRFLVMIYGVCIHRNSFCIFLLLKK